MATDKSNPLAEMQAQITTKNFVSHKTLRILRILFATLIVVACIYRFVYSWNSDIPALMYFTIQSNIACAALWFFKGINSRAELPKISLCVATYIAITGVVFFLVINDGFISTIYEKLRGGKIDDYIHYYALVVSAITHYMIPVLAVLDFLIFTDTQKLRPNLIVLAFPIGYLALATVYSLFSGKYVYPFLDPNYVGGFYIVLLILVLLLFVFVAVNRGLLRLNQKVQRKINQYYKDLLS